MRGYLSIKLPFSAVHVTKFTSDNTHILSASDDRRIKYWDLSSEMEILSFQEHMVSDAVHIYYLKIEYNYSGFLWNPSYNLGFVIIIFFFRLETQNAV